MDIAQSLNSKTRNQAKVNFTKKNNKLLFILFHVKNNNNLSILVYKVANDNKTETNDNKTETEEDLEELEDLSMMDEDLDEDADDVPVSKDGMFPSKVTIHLFSELRAGLCAND